MMKQEFSWQDYTERARAAVYFAKSEAIRFGDENVTLEYLMLGLIEDGGNVASRVLDRMGISLAKLRKEIEKHVEKKHEIGTGDTLSPECLRALENAYQEAKLLNNSYIG